jgi:hypothetical protein
VIAGSLASLQPGSGKVGSAPVCEALGAERRRLDHHHQTARGRRRRSERFRE